MRTSACEGLNHTGANPHLRLPLVAMLSDLTVVAMGCHHGPPKEGNTSFRWRVSMNGWPNTIIDWIISNAAWVIVGALFLRFWIWITDKKFTARKEIAFWIFVPLVLFFTFSRVGLLNRPQFSVSIDRVHVLTESFAQVTPGSSDPNQSTNPYKDDLALLIVASVANAGMPSMANCCNLTITIPGSGSVSADHIAMPKEFDVKDPSSLQVVDTYYNTDALYDKLGTRPLATGELIRGDLLFGVSGVPYQTLVSPGTRYDLTLNDVTGKVYTGTMIWPIKPSQMNGYIAGLTGGTCPPPPVSSAALPAAVASPLDLSTDPLK